MQEPPAGSANSLAFGRGEGWHWQALSSHHRGMLNHERGRRHVGIGGDASAPPSSPAYDARSVHSRRLLQRPRNESGPGWPARFDPSVLYLDATSRSHGSVTGPPAGDTGSIRMNTGRCANKGPRGRLPARPDRTGPDRPTEEGRARPLPDRPVIEPGQNFLGRFHPGHRRGGYRSTGVSTCRTMTQSTSQTSATLDLWFCPCRSRLH